MLRAVADLPADEEEASVGSSVEIGEPRAEHAGIGERARRRVVTEDLATDSEEQREAAARVPADVRDVIEDEDVGDLS